MNPKYLYNPFNYIAGAKSLFIGIVILGVATFAGTFTNLHFDGVMDIHTGYKAPMWFYFAEVFASWLIVSALLYLSALIISKSKVRIIDVFGTQILAKAPLILASLISFIPFFQFEIEPTLPKISTNLIIFGILSLAIIVWVVILMYNAFSISANVKGTKAIVTFIISMVLAEIAAKATLMFIAKSNT